MMRRSSQRPYMRVNDYSQLSVENHRRDAFFIHSLLKKNKMIKYGKNKKKSKYLHRPF